MKRLHLSALSTVVILSIPGIAVAEPLLPNQFNSNPACYMELENGNMVDLSSLCGQGNVNTTRVNGANSSSYSAESSSDSDATYSAEDSSGPIGKFTAISDRCTHSYTDDLADDGTLCGSRASKVRPAPMTAREAIEYNQRSLNETFEQNRNSINRAFGR